MHMTPHQRWLMVHSRFIVLMCTCSSHACDGKQKMHKRIRRNIDAVSRAAIKSSENFYFINVASARNLCRRFLCDIGKFIDAAFSPLYASYVFMSHFPDNVFGIRFGIGDGLRKNADRTCAHLVRAFGNSDTSRHITSMNIYVFQFDSSCAKYHNMFSSDIYYTKYVHLKLEV